MADPVRYEGKRRRSSGSSLAALGLRGLLGGAALDEYRLLIQGGSKGERCLSCSPAAGPEAVLLVWASKSKPDLGPYLWLGGPRRKSPDTWGCRTSEGRPLWEERNYRLPISPQCPRRKGTETHVTPEGVYKRIVRAPLGGAPLQGSELPSLHQRPASRGWFP